MVMVPQSECVGTITRRFRVSKSRSWLQEDYIHTSSHGVARQLVRLHGRIMEQAELGVLAAVEAEEKVLVL